MRYSTSSAAALKFEKRYAFIDGGCLHKKYEEHVKDWFGSVPTIDIGNVRNLTQADKLYYYDCLVIKKDGEDGVAFEARKAAQVSLFREYDRTERCHVRYGVLKKNTRKPKEPPQQKQVDIMLAVDMLSHAARGTMSHVTLLAGDQDFVPAVDALVDLGLTVEVMGDAKTTGSDLIHAADKFVPLGFNDYYAMVGVNDRKNHPLPEVSDASVRRAVMERATLIGSGMVGAKKGSLMQTNQTFLMMVERQDSDSTFDGLAILHPDRERLLTYCRLRFGKVDGF